MKAWLDEEETGIAGTGRQVAEIELTERNLRTLLAKLYRPGSHRTLERWDESGTVLFRVVAVPDDAHYFDRPPGTVHPADILTMLTQLSEELGLYGEEE